MDLKPPQAETAEHLVNHSGDLRLVENVQLAVADHINVRLIEFPEPAPLGPLPPVDLADLEPAERKRQFAVVQSHVFCQRHCQVKPQGQVTVPFLEAVDLLFRIAAALGQEYLGVFNGGGVQGGKAIGGIGAADDIGHPVKAELLVRQQLHKAGQGPGFDHFHNLSPFMLND